MNFLFSPIAHLRRAFFAAAIGIAVLAPASGTESLPSKTVFSHSLHRDLAYLLYLPPGYDPAGSTRYAVLYLLHGRGDNMSAWTTIKTDLDQLVTAGRIPPVIAVMPDASSNHRAGYYIDSQFTDGGESVESAFTQDLIAHIDATYPTRTDRIGRIVAGYSMGGYGALRYALAHPELFSAAIVLSPAVYVPLPPKDSSTREFGAFGHGSKLFDEEIYTSKNYPAIIPVFEATGLSLVMFIAVGDDEHALANPDDSAHDLDYEAHTLYNRIRRVPHITAQLRVVDGGHNWDTWRPTFIEGIQYVFRELSRAPSASSPTP